MCGIAGVFTPREQQCHPRKLADICLKMISALEHRGPDSDGIWSDKNIALGHRRLAIQDLSDCGHQPMSSHDHRYELVYNGEVYNFLELKKKLEQQGVTFKGHSDTEILLAAIQYWGLTQALNKFNGMFAFVLWDRKEQSLTLVQDRLGKKPLYFGWIGNHFVFGSELKALEQHPDFKFNINRDALALYLRYNYVPSPYAIFNNIYKLTQGSYLTIKYEQLNKQQNLLAMIEQYWSPYETAQQQQNNLFMGSFEQASNQLEQLIHDSTNIRMLSDVPLGLLLSGGIDSTTVAAIAQQQTQHAVSTFSLGFTKNDISEAAAAKKIAQHLKTDHHELYISGQDALDVLPEMPRIYDEPFGDSSQIPTYIVSKLARSQVTVALTGDGGDELFFGYKRYLSASKIWKANRKLPDFFRHGVAGLLQGAGRLSATESKMIKHASDLQADHPVDLYASRITKFMHPERFVLQANKSELANFEQIKKLQIKSPEFNMMLFDFTTFLTDDILVKVDRAAMATSLEVRNPLLDYRIVNFAWQLPMKFKYANNTGKFILRDVLARYVPDKLTNRPKQGFAPPIRQWLAGPLRDWADELLDEKRLRDEGYLDSQMISTIWQQCKRNSKKSHSRLWTILMFQAWLDYHKK